MYLDIQVPVKLMMEYMEAHRIEAYFLNKRKTAVNVVLGLGQNKRVIRSPIEKNKPLTQIEKSNIEGIVRSSKRIVMNSVKDDSLASCIMDSCTKYKKPVGVVVTTSFDNFDFVRDSLIPYATSIFNYDEIGTVFNPEHKSLGDENEKNIDALWGIGDALTLQHASGLERHSIYVTLGNNGVFAAGKDSKTYHIFLNNKRIKSQLSAEIPRREDATNGAGDHFAAAVLMYEERGESMVSAAVAAQINAICFIGYSGRISSSDFIVKPIDDKLLQRQKIYR